jgi:hypothetical protein
MTAQIGNIILTPYYIVISFGLSFRNHASMLWDSIYHAAHFHLQDVPGKSTSSQYHYQLEFMSNNSHIHCLQCLQSNVAQLFYSPSLNFQTLSSTDCTNFSAQTILVRLFMQYYYYESINMSTKLYNHCQQYSWSNDVAVFLLMVATTHCNSQLNGWEWEWSDWHYGWDAEKYQHITTINYLFGCNLAYVQWSKTWPETGRMIVVAIKY